MSPVWRDAYGSAGRASHRSLLALRVAPSSRLTQDQREPAHQLNKRKPMITVEIKPIALEQMTLLEEHLPMWSTVANYRDYFERQRRGEVICLIAWQDRFPIGRVLLKWVGVEHGCPYLGDLFVREDSRSSGVGSQLLTAAEQLTKEQGYQRTGLHVARDDLRARSLYDHRGYRDVQSYDAERPYLSKHHQEPRRPEVDVIYMVKLLS